MPDYKVLILDSVQTSQEERDRLGGVVRAVLESVAPHIKVAHLFGTEAHDLFFEQCGRDWTAWQTYMATGVHYETREPMSNAVCCVGRRVTKSAGTILLEALVARRMGLCWTDGRIFKVASVAVADAKDWQTGWVVTTEGDGVDPSTLSGV